MARRAGLDRLYVFGPHAPRSFRRISDPAAVEEGVLTEFTGLKRNRVWQATEILTALDDFAARARRPAR